MHGSIDVCLKDWLDEWMNRRMDCWMENESMPKALDEGVVVGSRFGL